MHDRVCSVCTRWAGQPREAQGHVGPEAGEAGEGGSGEPRRHELAQQGAVGSSEEQDRHHADTVKHSSAEKLDVASYRSPGLTDSVRYLPDELV